MPGKDSGQGGAQPRPGHEKGPDNLGCRGRTVLSLRRAVSGRRSTRRSVPIYSVPSYAEKPLKASVARLIRAPIGAVMSLAAAT